MRSVEFTLITDQKNNIKISLDADRIESLVSGAVMNSPGTTQIAMVSGRTFFVAHTYEDVKVLVYGTTDGISKAS